MSYLFRPTPVLNPGPSRDVVMSRLPAGTMRGYSTDVNWHGFFDEARRACHGKPWIVKSGTMGSYLGDINFDSTLSDLPLAPVSSSLSLTPLDLPVSFWDMPQPVAPAITAYDPGAPPSPWIVSSGGSITSPVATGAPGTSITSLINSIASLGTNIARAATGQQVSPTSPPIAPATVMPTVQSLQAQAAALQASNPALAAQYTAQANALMASAGVSSTSSFTGWLTGSTVIPGLPNWGTLAGGVAIALIGISAMKAGKRK